MPITFVKEYCNYTKDFRKEPDSVAAIDVSFCHLLEINNRDSSNQRTIFSLSHLTDGQLKYPNTGIIQSNLEKILSSFSNSGGDIKTAQIRIYGGKQHQSELRENLKKALKSTLGDDVQISEPIGHHMHNSRDSMTYLFSSNNVSYRRSDMNIEDGYKDEFSKDMLNKDGSVNKAKVDQFQKTIDESYYPISRAFDSIVKKRSSEILNYTSEQINSFSSLSKKHQDNILSLLSVELVDRTGFKINSYKQELPSSTFSSATINTNQKNILGK